MLISARIGSDCSNLSIAIDLKRAANSPVDEKILLGKIPPPIQLAADALEGELPTRILPQPIPIPTPMPDLQTLVMIDRHPFVLDKLRHATRIDQVEWWASDPVCRDYARARLVADDSFCDAWVFYDRDDAEDLSSRLVRVIRVRVLVPVPVPGSGSGSGSELGPVCRQIGRHDSELASQIRRAWVRAGMNAGEAQHRRGMKSVNRFDDAMGKPALLLRRHRPRVARG